MKVMNKFELRYWICIILLAVSHTETTKIIMLIGVIINLVAWAVDSYRCWMEGHRDE